MSRQLGVRVVKILGSYDAPDTGLQTVFIHNEDHTQFAQATENPGGSGYYIATWAETPKFGHWSIAGTDRLDLGKIWLGKDGQIRPTFMFRKVEVYHSSDSPSGAKGNAKVFTSGTSPIGTDIDGNTSYSFTKVPIVAIANKYQERGAFISTDPSLTGNNVTFQVSVDDTGETYSDGKCYVDIVIISMD